jgi:hypothetical protein
MGVLMEEWKKKDEERKERLKTNPDGFHLEGHGYTCQICKRSMSDKQTWYDAYGLTCLLCRDARKNGIIPDYLIEDKAQWYSVYDLEHCFGVKGQTVRKLFRNGKLKGRVVPSENGTEHFLLFLVEDNKGVLPLKPNTYDAKIKSPFPSLLK